MGISIGNKLHDPTSHGEAVAIRDACKHLKTSDLKGATLYASLEPCLMCLSAVMWANISKIVFACRKEQVSPEYYGGSYSSSKLNSKFAAPIEFQYVANLEHDSLKVVHDWERTWQ